MIRTAFARSGSVASVVLVLLAVANPAATADVYRWTDDDGNVHYGAQPPAGSDARPVDLDTAPAAAQADEDSPATARERVESDRDPPAEPAAGTAPPPLSADVCERLEDDLLMLESNPAGILVQDDEGSVRRMPQEEREQRMDEIRDRLDNRCR